MVDTYYAEAAARHMRQPVLEMLNAEINRQVMELDDLHLIPPTSDRDLAEVHILREMAHDLEVRAMCRRAQSER
jgi:hypothetical protein